MTTIGSLKYDIVADTAQFQKGMVATRRELTAAKKLFMDTRTPAENLGIEIDGLSRLLSKGAIDQETYNRAVRDLKRQTAVANGGIASLKANFDSLSGSLKAAAKGFIAYKAAGASLRFAREELERIDDAAKKSRRLGLVADDLIALRLAGEQLAGVTGGTVDMALQRMVRRISEAAKGSGEAQKAIQELGLSAELLNTAGPAQAFSMIADSIRGVSNETDRLRLAQKLFDSEGVALVNVLNEGGDVLDQYRHKAYELGLLFSKDLSDSVEAANDKLGETGHKFASASRNVLQHFVPAIELATDVVDRFQVGLDNLVLWGGVIGAGRGPQPRIIGNTPGTMAGPRDNSEKLAKLREQAAKEERRRVQEKIAADLRERRQAERERQLLMGWAEADQKAAEQFRREQMRTLDRERRIVNEQRERQRAFENASRKWRDAEGRANPEILDARSAEGFAQLRASTNRKPAEMMVAEQKKGNRNLDNIRGIMQGIKDKMQENPEIMDF